MRCRIVDFDKTHDSNCKHNYLVNIIDKINLDSFSANHNTTSQHFKTMKLSFAVKITNKYDLSDNDNGSSVLRYYFVQYHECNGCIIAIEP